MGLWRLHLTCFTFGYKDNRTSLSTGTLNQGICHLTCVNLFKPESLDNTNMKEIKGLDERLAGLQQLLQNVQTLTQSQADMAQGFQQNQARAQNIGDPSVLPDLCASHQKQLMMLMKNHSHLR